MKFDSLGLPQENGASDLQDSARLAGIMKVFGHPSWIPLSPYIQVFPWQYMRHPKERIYDFSRDQAICFFAGLYASNVPGLVDIRGVTGKDFWSPAAMGHVARCQGRKATWFQDLWFWAELWFSAKVKPLEELNQIFCQLMIADPKFIKWYCKANPVWQSAVTDYWNLWRNEPELANLMIQKINLKINT